MDLPAEPLRNNVSLLYDFNALEGLFENNNWMIVDKKDTSYFYFSRVNPYFINTYLYKIIKGDSVKTVLTPIQSDKQTKITWQWNKQNLQLSTATIARVVWKLINEDSAKVEFLKLDNNQISFFPSGN